MKLTIWWGKLLTSNFFSRALQKAQHYASASNFRKKRVDKFEEKITTTIIVTIITNQSLWMAKPATVVISQFSLMFAVGQRVSNSLSPIKIVCLNIDFLCVKWIITMMMPEWHERVCVCVWALQLYLCAFKHDKFLAWSGVHAQNQPVFEFSTQFSFLRKMFGVCLSVFSYRFCCDLQQCRMKEVNDTLTLNFNWIFSIVFQHLHWTFFFVVDARLIIHKIVVTFINDINCLYACACERVRTWVSICRMMAW